LIDGATYTYPTGQNSQFNKTLASVTPPVGFTKYLGATSLSAHSIGSSDIHVFRHAIEGFNIADLGWGSANAKSVTLSLNESHHASGRSWHLNVFMSVQLTIEDAE
jgi:hypothetical protein